MDEFAWLDEPVTVTKGDLEHLLHFARYGDVALSQRRWRHGFRHVAICSDPKDRDPDCASCQAFKRVEQLVPEAS